jgi:altronate hydrolase
MKHKVLKIKPNDNVLVALTNLAKGEVIIFENVAYTLLENINAKHKFFTTNLKAGDPIIMYGVLVGKAQQQIVAGTLMTTANTKHATQSYQYRATNFTWTPPNIEKFTSKMFNGFHRSDGRVGTANYWLFIPTVFCENRNLDVIKEALVNELGYGVTEKYKLFVKKLIVAKEQNINLENVTLEPFSLGRDGDRLLFPNVSGIKFLNHEGGCGGIRQDAAMLGKLLAAYANHPNVGGVTILSLGCQNLQTNELLDEIKITNPNFDKPLYVFEQQQSQSEEQLISDAIKKTFLGLIEINKQERKPASLNKLCIGVKCGGSDGFSGISANPAVGYFSDLLVALGGKILLAEFPELCGAEQNLLDRTPDEANANKFMQLMKTYSDNVEKVGSNFAFNPSPGNIKDGLITDAMKSNGAALKGGTSPIIDVLDYSEKATKPGLSLVCTPGNDVEATTGKAASGATLILFTTGLGTPTGNPICPTIKISTNSNLTKRMNDIIDIDCGPIVDGDKTIEQMGEDILEYCIKAASGDIIPKAVLLNQDDFIPWKRGVSL